MKAQQLEVQNLKVGGVLRLTECAATPLKNGDQVRVEEGIAQDLIRRHQGLLKPGPISDVDGLARGHWEPVKSAPGTTDTQAAAAAPEASKAGQAATKVAKGEAK